MNSIRKVLRSENDVAKLYRSRYESITQVTTGSDPTTDSVINALMGRLDNEENLTDFYRNKRDEADQRSLAIQMKLTREESEWKNTEDKMIQFGKRLEDTEARRSESDNWIESRSELREKERKIAFLESETDRLDRNEQRASGRKIFGKMGKIKITKASMMISLRLLRLEEVNQANLNLAFPVGKLTKSSFLHARSHMT